MWVNNDENMFMYIDDKIKKDGWKGCYLVCADCDVNEPFHMKTKSGISGDVGLETKDSSFLKKNMVVKLKLDDGMMEITDKNNKKTQII